MIKTLGKRDLIQLTTVAYKLSFQFVVLAQSLVIIQPYRAVEWKLNILKIKSYQQ
jgi:hypothetical protein